MKATYHDEAGRLITSRSLLGGKFMSETTKGYFYMCLTIGTYGIVVSTNIVMLEKKTCLGYKTLLSF